MSKKQIKKDRKKSNVLDINEDDYIQKKEVLTSFFLDKTYTPMTQKQIMNILGVPNIDKPFLELILDEIELEGIIFLDESKRYVLCSKKNVVKCVFETKSQGYGFGIIDNDDDIYISVANSMGAMNKDVILVKILEEAETGRKKEGKVIKIIKRNVTKVVGRYIDNKNFGFVVPIDGKINDIYIPKKYTKGLKNDIFVEVEIIKYATSNSKAEGKIVKVIGNGKESNIEVKALYRAYNLDYLENFNELVMNELENIPSIVTESEKVGRVDKTNENMYTIDGDDAKDLDDAVCVKRIGNDKYLLSVCIADVSHYVKGGTALDNEAIARGTSIYIPGTVIPMLPKKLSNGICSLNEGVERLALGIDMVIDNTGEVIESTVYKAVIKSKKQMTYDKVYKVIMKEDKDVLNEYKEYQKDIFLMRELALILMDKRHKDGSINFDIPETKVILNENGDVVDIAPYNITIANKIIEEFMLVANMTIAEKFFFLELPFIYRIHEQPDEGKLHELNEILSNYHKKIKGIKNIHPKTLSDIIDSIEDEEEKQIISNSVLRALKLAKYSNECLRTFWTFC